MKVIFLKPTELGKANLFWRQFKQSAVDRSNHEATAPSTPNASQSKPSKKFERVSQLHLESKDGIN